MLKEKIGQDAGLIWTALESNGTLEFKALKKESKLKEKELLCALGWLAREGKVTFHEDEKDLFVRLS
jgi:hypothetical protein